MWTTITEVIENTKTEIVENNKQSVREKLTDVSDGSRKILLDALDIITWIETNAS